jgi:predicted nucleic acid-binding protein
VILADSNVLLDVITADPKWGRWSLAALDEWARRGVLPDFFVGAHAAVLDFPLLTRDTHRYRAYFPTLRLVTPTLRSHAG